MRSGAKYWLFFLGALIVATINFGGAFDNRFRDDDFVCLATAIDQNTLHDTFEPKKQFAFYRPLSMGLFYVEYRLFGLSGGLYILFNYLLHIVNSLFLYKILTRLGLSRWSGFVASSLFLIGFGHYGKQVMWACTSGGLVTVTLALTAILLSVLWMNNIRDAEGARRQGRWSIYPALIFILAVVAPTFHEMGLIVPILLIMVAWYYMRSRMWRHAGILLTITAPVAIWLLVIFVLFRSSPTRQHLFAVEPMHVARVIEYIGFMVIPIQRSEYFVFGSPFLNGLVSIARPLHVVIGAVFVGWTFYIIRHRRHLDGFLSLWLYVALVPFCFVATPHGWLELRYVYFAALPMSALAAVIVSRLHTKTGTWKRSIAVVLYVGMIVGSLILVRLLEAKYDRISRDPTNMHRFEEIKQKLSHPSM